MAQLDIQALSATKLASESKLTYSVVMHHLRLLRDEDVVERKGTRRYVWLPTGLGQKRLG